MAMDNRTNHRYAEAALHAQKQVFERRNETSAQGCSLSASRSLLHPVRSGSPGVADFRSKSNTTFTRLLKVACRSDPQPNQYKRRTFDRSVALLPQSFLAVNRRRCMRYMAAILIVLLLFSTHAYAVTCKNYEPPNDETISVEIESDLASISAPSVLDGKSLSSLMLIAYVDIEGHEEELSVPLAFTNDGSIVKGEFQFSSLWAEFQILASYGNEICGPRLEYTIAI